MFMRNEKCMKSDNNTTSEEAGPSQQEIGRWPLALFILHHRLAPYFARPEPYQRFCQNSNHIWLRSPFSGMLIVSRNGNEEHETMKCPHCAAPITKKRAKKTKLGYSTFFCPQCRSTFYERIGTLFNYLEFLKDIVLRAVVWRLRYKLSLHDVAEMFLERGFTFTHEAIRNWETRFAPLLADQLRTRRRGQAGKSWYVDETYLKVHGK